MSPDFFHRLFTVTPLLDLIALALGLVVGSFLNVLALRTLAEQSIVFPASHCPRCKHALAFEDNIPVLSWLILRGKCRYCRGPIHWQYPAVELFTALTFVGIERCFLDPIHSPFNAPYWNNLLSVFLNAQQQMQLSRELPNLIITAAGPSQAWQPEHMVWLAAGALFLACTLIALCVTDFREKLIPHDITYPAMIVGIVYSATVRQDLVGAMIGIGASYIIFDFIAFYGLKLYLLSHADEVPARPRLLRRRLQPRRRRRLSRRLRWRLDLAAIDRTEQAEPIEVMGGGDAVLSAVMSAFLGWQLLVVALVLGFLSGTIIGLGLLFNNMRQANLLHKCVAWSGTAAAIGAAAFGVFGFALERVADMQYGGGDAANGVHIAVPMCILGALSGALFGVVKVGTRVSKPYPFAPALSIGGFLALFLLPNWVYLSAIAPTQH